MKKLISTLLAGVIVAASAIGVGASDAGLYEYNPYNSEYWSAVYASTLDKTAPAIWFEDGNAGGYNGSSYVDATGAVYIDDLTAGWYEVVFCGLGSNAEDFPEDVDGKIAFTVRGESTFQEKSENAMNAGAIACLVGNNCPDNEQVNDDGNVSSGYYYNTIMSLEDYTVPMGFISSDCTVRLVADTADIAISEAVHAVSNGELPKAKNSTWVYIGTEEEYKANLTRTDANTVTADKADDVIFTDNQLLITVACPVDVTVSYGGEILSSVPEKYSAHASFGTLSVSADGEKKTLRLLADKAYNIKIEGTDDGTMTVTVKYPGTAKEVVVFEDVPVSASMSATVNTDNTKNQNAVMRYSNGGKNKKIVGEKTCNGEKVWVEEVEEKDDTPSNSVIFPKLYNVTVTSGEGGKTNTSDKFYIAYGASRTIKITPDDGYEVADVLVNGKSVGAVDSYSIKGACKNYSVKVSFVKIPD